MRSCRPARFFPSVVSIASMAIVLLTPAASAQELLHGVPAFDSGWQGFGSDDVAYVWHNLGGNVDDFVVDLQFYDRIHGESGFGVHQVGYGGDDTGGAWWQGLTPAYIDVHRSTVDTVVFEFRVRIWIVPSADWDSGWMALDPGTIWTPNHGLGGNIDDYVVYLEQRDPGSYGVNHIDAGLDRWRVLGGQFAELGAAWSNLSTSTISVLRGAHDSVADEVRVRIWRKTSPAWDSGWVDMSSTLESVRNHDLGGPWNDFVVDIQARPVGDTNPSGVYLGGETWEEVDGSWTEVGAYWSELTHRRITLTRLPDDTVAEQLRVRIWNSRRPKWQSEWLDLAQGETITINPPGSYLGLSRVYDLQVQDTGDDGTSEDGLNHRGYGGDIWQDEGLPFATGRGVWWTKRFDGYMDITRNAQDTSADRVRMRAWIPPEPEHNSGDTALNGAGQETLFSYPWAGYLSDLVVDLRVAGTGAFVSLGYGTDLRYNTGPPPSFTSPGVCWRNLSNTSLAVYRGTSDDTSNSVLVRLWRNTQFDFDSGWRAVAPGQAQQIYHGLGAAADEMVVDLQFRDSASLGVHQQRYGSDSVWAGPSTIQVAGAHWERLGANEIIVERGADDSEADEIRVRILSTQWRAFNIFADGFESGDVSGWSTAVMAP